MNFFSVNHIYLQQIVAGPMLLLEARALPQNSSEAPGISCPAVAFKVGIGMITQSYPIVICPFVPYPQHLA